MTNCMEKKDSDETLRKNETAHRELFCVHYSALDHTTVSVFDVVVNQWTNDPRVLSSIPRLPS